jgi:Domain of unknown function (DUF4157)
MYTHLARRVVAPRTSRRSTRGGDHAPHSSPATAAPLLRDVGRLTVNDPLGGTHVAPLVAEVLHRRRGVGVALDDRVAAAAESVLGTDLGSVRVHADDEADRVARALQAVAFTSGADVYFSQGGFAPATREGQRLLAHELVHVAQQQRGAFRGAVGTVGRADDPSEQHADALTSTVVDALGRHPTPPAASVSRAAREPVAKGPQASSSGVPVVRRESAGYREWRPAEGPKAGFEQEFKNVFVFSQYHEYPIRAAETAKRRMLAGQETTAEGGWIGSIGKTGVDPPCPKRTKIFSAPGRTWTAETDTTFPGLSNLEIVSAPLTPDQMETPVARSDQRMLSDVLARLGTMEKRRSIRPGLLSAHLLVHQDDAFLWKKPGSLSSFMQVTRAIQAPRNAEEQPDSWIPGLNWNAWPILLQTFAKLEKPRYSESNPKQELGAHLVKSPLTRLLGVTEEDVPEDDKNTWINWAIQEIGRAAGKTIALSDEVALGLYTFQRDNYPLNALKRTGFTWEVLLRELLAGKDCLGIWSKTAFGGIEDFGLGMIDDPSLAPGWYIEELRSLGTLSLSQLETKQAEWRAGVRERTERRQTSGVDPRN